MEASVRNVVRLVLIVFLACAPAGCSQSMAPEEEAGEPVSFHRPQSFFPATYSGITESMNGVIRTREEWEAFWERFRTANRPATPPSVDFQEAMVMVSAMGTRNTGGYAVQIVRVRELDDGSLSVVVKQTTPGDDCVTTQSLTEPVDAVVAPRSDGPVRFEAESEIHRCGDGGGDDGGRGY